MNKTLIVSYTPRNGSYTKKVLGEFIEQVKEKTEITELDLLDSPPDLLSAAHIALTMKWNAGQREFTPQESVILERNHGMANQLLKADYLVLASPVYNFSLPAMVKAWIDAIIVSNKTFSFNPQEGFKGLCGDKKALVLLTGGFDYENGSSVAKQFASALLTENFKFMGMETTQISAFGLNENWDKANAIVEQAKQEVRALANKWY